MAKELTQNVVLREHPGALPTAFKPGDKLPAWAVEQLDGKDHLFADYRWEDAYFRGRNREKAVIPKPADQKAGRDYTSGLSVTPPVGSKIEEELDEPDDEPDLADRAPSRGGSKAAWIKFAEEAIAEGFPVVLNDGMDREDIIKACEVAEVIPTKDADSK